MEIYVDEHHRGRSRMLINLAKVYVHHLGQPRKAIQTLKRLGEKDITSDQIRIANALARKSRKMILAGSLEVE